MCKKKGFGSLNSKSLKASIKMVRSATWCGLNMCCVVGLLASSSIGCTLLSVDIGTSDSSQTVVVVWPGLPVPRNRDDERRGRVYWCTLWSSRRC
jgi:hypothetical protein